MIDPFTPTSDYALTLAHAAGEKAKGAKFAALTDAQRRPLAWLNEEGDRVLYGPMSNGMGGCHGFGGAGTATLKTILLATGQNLLRRGLIRHVRDKYPLGYYAITDAGREALAKAAPSPSAES